ncbi:hypothetical protein [Burkholderia ubonensis]|uniref:hypothetical protein n=1 Tax=Burkholderia ubonensis TaxID=101571 RepID=UPI0012FCEA83|nr:hypothetical protein [Burkholderia ubonensis]
MKRNSIQWESLTLFRAGKDAFSLPTIAQSDSAGLDPCPQGVLRFNVADIHEVKKFWEVRSAEQK